MFNLQRVSIDFLTSVPVLVAAAVLVLLVLTWLLYRRTNPPLPRYWRLALGIIRLLALVVLIAVLSEPIIGFSREFERTPRVTLLLDNSLSMEKTESGKPRRARADSLLSSRPYSQLKKQADVTTYYFGGNLVTSREKVDRDRTALGEALYGLEQLQLGQPADFWLLIGDGRHNSGRDPAGFSRHGRVPIIAVDISGGAGNFDVALSDIDFNPVVFSGQKTAVEVAVHWQDAANKALRVELRDSIRVVGSGRLSISQEVGQGSVTIDYLPTEPGQRILDVTIPALEGEETVDNNRRSFAVKVLKSRLAVLIVAEHPDYEVGFLKRFLEQSGKYDVELAAIGSKLGNLTARFPSTQAELNRFDLVILYDPDPARLDAHQDILRSFVAEKGGALWVLMGSRFAERGPVAWFNALLPFSPSRRQPIEYRQFTVQPAEGYLLHPAVRIEETQTAIREAWNELPPFQSVVPCDIIADDAVILAHAIPPPGDLGRLPVLGYRRLGPGKVFATSARPFWTWAFISRGFGEDAGHYARFTEGVVSWLTVRDDFDPIRVTPVKEVFSRGEVVGFDGFAFDLGYRPIPGVAGNVRLIHTARGDTVQTDLLEIAAGKYRAEFANLPPGTYQYAAQLEKDGSVLKSASGRILVEQFSLEEFDQRGNPTLLAALARLSGGDYFTFQEFNEAIVAIDRTPVAVAQSGEIQFWHQWWLLIIIVGALCLEWVLRKTMQLV